MSPPVQHKAPGHLSAPSRRLWDTIHSEYALEDPQREVLRLALEARDQAATANRRVRRDGLMIQGRYGLIAHPAVTIEKQAAERYASLLDRLHLVEPEEPEPPKRARTGRGRG